MLKNVYLAGGVRTPFGTLNGALSGLSAAELGSIAVRNTLERTGVDGADVDEVIIGNVIGAGVGQNIARQVSLGAGIPQTVGATTVNKVCGSAMHAVILASQAIQCGDAGLVVAGGCESMSNAPYLLKKARGGYRMGHSELIDAMIHDGLWDVYGDKHMGTCGHQCAAKYDISREEQDDFAIASYDRAIQAWDSGYFKEETVPVEIKTRKGTVTVERDEDLDRYRGADKLRGLKPAFGPDTTVTAGNASGINDGAASVIVFDDERRESLGLTPRARILGYANAAGEPEWFTTAPIFAIRKLCEKLDLKLGDVDLFEINEAFAVVALVAMRELKLDHAKVNVAGGAVGIGHPIGASGARIVNTLVHALHHYDKKIGIAAICLGGGEADAIAVERCA
ncbi:MAG: thiolase family protein [Planctomycetes bacterium]|nr:thiolase family protein [Planctomycetota bacterium]